MTGQLAGELVYNWLLILVLLILSFGLFDVLGCLAKHAYRALSTTRSRTPTDKREHRRLGNSRPHTSTD